jgi:hypothetical protein
MKFNLITRKKKVIVNYAGEKAYSMTPEYELYAAVVTTGLNRSFYETANSRLDRIIKLIQKCDPEFVAKLAVYARNNMYLRSIPLVLTVELAKQTTGNSLVSNTVNKVVKRADEITELLAYYQFANKRTGVKKLNKLSKQIQKGLVKSFNNFDEYQFAKYNKATDVKLKDALFLVHPKAKDEAQQALFNKIANDALETPYTWETELSKLGQNKFANNHEKSRAMKRKWEELIISKRLGYMALMRNLRNILEANVSASTIEMVCTYLANENAVMRAKQMPFRFLAAYRELQSVRSQYTSAVLDALEIATMHSAKNIKGFDYATRVVIACDVSGSMQQPISPKSKVLLYDVGLMLGMLLHSQCKNVTAGMFGNTWKTINLPKRSVLSNVQTFYRREGEVGYSTNGYKVIESLIAKNQIVDKVMIFTDVQMWNSNNTNHTFAKSWATYKRMAPLAKLYLFDLAGYGQQPLRMEQNDVYLMAGWSDKIFDMLNALEQSASAINEINKIKM